MSRYEGRGRSKWSPAGEGFRDGWSRGDETNRSREREPWRDRDSRHRHDRDRRRSRDRSPTGHRGDRSPDRGRRSRSPERPRAARAESVDSNGSPRGRGSYDNPDGSAPAPGDWYCKCGALNFRRRNVCYWRDCGAKREDVGAIPATSGAAKGTSVAAAMTRVLLLEPIGPQTTAEDVLSALSTRCSAAAMTMSGVSLIRGGARLQFNTLGEASGALTQIEELRPSLMVDGRAVTVSYYSGSSHAAELPAPVNPDYTAYYSTYVSETDRVNAAAALAQSAIHQLAAARSQWAAVAAPPPTPPDGDGSRTYFPPDVSSFLYDDTSGYYYDSSTGLYYDANTQYFYNNRTTQYLYWDAARSTYLLAPDAKKASAAPAPATENPASAAKAPVAEAEKEEKKKPVQREDKVKIAKKIAKDMERWAKTLNQKKENARNGVVVEQQTYRATPSSGSADIGFSVLESGESRARPAPPFTGAPRYDPPPPTREPEHETVREIEPAEDDPVDWLKLSCLLCKRQFNSQDVLKKHVEMSTLHRENLERQRRERDEPEEEEEEGGGAGAAYRDRAAERRLKAGPEERPPFRTQLQAIRSRGPPAAAPAERPLEATSLGGRLLSKMGWSEGTGLGRSRSGRTSPVRAERRSTLAGLGQKRGVYQAAPGETYRDTVKKLAMARYRDLLQEEGDGGKT